jgi:cytochrome P450
MTVKWRPPGLALRDEASVRWTSFTKVIRNPEDNWPRQILDRPIIVGQIERVRLALIADPDAAKAVLTGGEDRFPKWKIYDRVFAKGMGRHGLSVVQGEQWRRQHKVFAPMFRPGRVGDLAMISGQVAERSCRNWLERRADIRIDVAAEMTLITLASIWALMFGDTDRDLSLPLIIRAAADISAAQVQGRINETPEHFTNLVREVQRLAGKSNIPGASPFAGLLDADSANGPLNPVELFDNARLFLGAGSETTALTLTWALWLIGHSPGIQRRAQEEIDSVTGDQPITPEHVARLAFVGQVLNETLRLYPPSVVVVRQARGDESLAGEFLPAGSVLAICLYALHRHERWWSEPQDFRPDRFAVNSSEPRHAFAFLPFSAGQHACIGRQAGWVEAVVVLATILRRFDVVADPTIPVSPRVSITMRPDREVTLFMRPCSERISR